MLRNIFFTTPSLLFLDLMREKRRERENKRNPLLCDAGHSMKGEILGGVVYVRRCVA